MVPYCQCYMREVGRTRRIHRALVPYLIQKKKEYDENKNKIIKKFSFIRTEFKISSFQIFPNHARASPTLLIAQLEPTFPEVLESWLPPSYVQPPPPAATYVICP